MRRHVVVVLAGLWLLSTTVAARMHEIRTPVVLISAMFPARPAAPAVKVPDTPAGRALSEFVASFNAGGRTRQTWLQTRTLGHGGMHATLADAQLRARYGQLSVVRVVSSSHEFVAAVVRHGASYKHTYLTIAVQPAAPHKAASIDMRDAKPDEVQGAGILARLTGRWEGFLRVKRPGAQ